jgi:acyl transferase domain-containing protein
MFDLCAVPAASTGEAFARVQRLTSHPFGVRASARLIHDSAWYHHGPCGPEVVCVPIADCEDGRFEEAIWTITRAGLVALAEVRTRSEARRVADAGASGLVVAGNEAGGWCGTESSCALVQAALDDGKLPVWVRGGIGSDTAARCVAAGAAGVVLEGVLLLSRESPMEPHLREAIARCDGDDTIVIRPSSGASLRVFALPGAAALSRLRSAASEGGPAWRRAVHREVGWERGQCLPIGQDAALAEGLARKFVTAGGIVQAVAQAIREGTGADTCAGTTSLLDQETAAARARDGTPTLPGQPSDIAVIGMAAVFPNAGCVSKFWSNTLRGLDSIIEVPADRWDWRLYYDPDPKAPDKIVSRWGGFLPDVAFDPLVYGMPPSSLPSIEPAQLLALEVVRNALADAGYAERPFPRERTAVVLGMGGGAAQLAMGYAFRSYLPMLETVLPGGGQEAMESCRGLLPEWTEDSFPGFLLNVTAGRIANRLNLGGANYTVDAACGSSLAAASLAVRELETGSADLVVLGGVDTVQNPFTYLAFSKSQAFSPRGRCRPFDASADGIVISEGVAALVLKRLTDAERDGDRIYAVIKGVGASSDGRARGLTAPVVEGQIRALERAYAKAGLSPKTVGYVEAHGTGTALGDVVEVEALLEVFRTAGATVGQCVLGSVKSQIGHTKCAAGLAGLINASLALYHKVVPPTIGIETPNPTLDVRAGPFRLCTEAQPWVHSEEDRPRRAGVSAFGFGGTNFHAVLEAYEGNLAPGPAASMRDWPSELLVWQAAEPAQLNVQLEHLIGALDSGARPHLCDLSHALLQKRALGMTRAGAGAGSGATLVILAAAHEDLRARLQQARDAIAAGREHLDDPRGAYYEARPAWAGQPVAFIFPGQGSQAPNMLRALAAAFPEVRDAFEEFDRVAKQAGGQAVSPLVFPAPAFDDAARERARRALLPTEVAQPALGAACLGMMRLLQSLDCVPDFVAGHSFGELVALHAASVLSSRSLAELAIARGRLMQEASHAAPGAMAAVLADADGVAALLAEAPAVRLANWNGPRQTVVAGPSAAVNELVALATKRAIQVRVLPVSCACHTPLVASARDALIERARDLLAEAPRRPVYSNFDAKPHPADPGSIAHRLGEHLTSPVRFAEMIEAMHQDGARVFLEVGPGAALTPLIDEVLREQPHLALSCDAAGSPGMQAWLRTIARLVVAGLPLRLDRLTEGRWQRVLDLENLPGDDRPEPLAPSTWLVNGSRARPLFGPEPKRLGIGPPVARARSAAPQTSAPASVPQAPLLTTPAPGGDRVIESFQRTMQLFLEVQRSTMLAYLARGGSGQAGPLGPEQRAPGSSFGQAAVQEQGVPHDMGSPMASSCADPPSAPESFRTLGRAGSEPERETPDAHADYRMNGFVPDPAEVLRPAKVPDERRAPGSNTPRFEVPPDRELITARLLQIVRDRTGYPIQTLGLDLDMEADLGIDSIKRVEILGKLRDEFPRFQGLPESAETTDALARARTLGAVVERMVSLVPASPGAIALLPSAGEASSPRLVPSASEGQASVTAASAPDKLQQAGLRRLLEVVEAPLTGQQLSLMSGGRLVISDDGRGVAERLAACLDTAGVAAERIGGPEATVDWSSPSAIGAALERVRSRGPLAGIVHASPLGRAVPVNGSQQAWASRVTAEVRGLFLLAQAAADDLERAARDGGAVLIAATALGGRFASADCTGSEFFPGQGGIAGLVKTLAREWPAVRCRVVDSALEDPADVLASRLAAEIFAADGWPEVGYEHGRRIRVRTTASPLDCATATLELEPGEPVLISGGARGITALVAMELAKIWQPALLLLGTTALPAEAEAPDTANLRNEAEIKAALHERLRSDGRAGNPAEIEAAYQALRRVREVRANLALLRAAGATVEYAQVDVRDSSELAGVLAEWRVRFGDPVGLIHGAGLIKDKLIRQKTLESFDRVLAIKLDGALNLIRLVRPETLKFTAFFSSIAGRFGNVGQTDYAAANEVLNKLAHWLNRRWPGRVVSVIWGPWSGVGMVSQIESHLGRRGLELIAPGVGSTLLVDELRYGRKGDVEVIYAGGLGSLEEPIERAAVAEPAELVP